jgi:hypothetical protein
VPALPSRRGPQLRRENVVDLVPLAVLVDALGVAGPAGHDRRRPGDRTAGRELVPDDREQELGIKSEVLAHSRATVSRTSGLENRSMSWRAY